MNTIVVKYANIIGIIDDTNAYYIPCNKIAYIRTIKQSSKYSKFNFLIYLDHEPGDPIIIRDLEPNKVSELVKIFSDTMSGQSVELDENGKDLASDIADQVLQGYYLKKIPEYEVITTLLQNISPSHFDT